MKLLSHLFAAATALLLLSASVFAGILPYETTAFDKAVAVGKRGIGFHVRSLLQSMCRYQSIDSGQHESSHILDH